MPQEISAEEYLEIAQKLRSTHKLSKAESFLSEALQVHPSHEELLVEAASVSYEFGQKESAAAYMEKAIEVNPKKSEYHRYLSMYKSYKNLDDPHIIQLISLVDDPNIVGAHKSDCHFALGKAYEDLKQYKESFEHYKRGNDIHSKRVAFSLDNPKVYFEKIIENFTKEFVEENQNNTEYDITPIFIVGMPRSGTSLTDQTTNQCNAFT